MWWLSISVIDSSVSSIKKKISKRKHVHHDPSSKYASRCWEKRKWLHVFFWYNWTISWSSNESSRKHENTALKSTMIKQWNSNTPFAVELTPFHPWVCLYHTYAVRNLILRCLTDSLMTILSKSNYHVRLNVNMDIAHSISFNFNFGNGYYFVLRLKQHFFDEARFFLSE